MTLDAPVLEVEGLTVTFKTRRGVVRAVEDVGLRVARGQTLGLVGESGSGKSVTAMAIMRLLPRHSTTIVADRMAVQGQDILALGADALPRLRGRLMGMIFQEPLNALNPTMTVGDQIVEAARHHLGLDRRAALDHAAAMLSRVRLPDAARRLESYPHELSGGMRQRVMIAIALSCAPALLIADEPTTALDVTTQAQILDLIAQLRAETGTAVLLVTHDFGVIASMADHVAVMYAGQIVEYATVRDIFAAPKHPYTQGLLRAIPRLGARFGTIAAKLLEIPGTVPGLHERPAGCRFANRCPLVQETCMTQVPPIVDLEGGHSVRCWLHT